MFDQIFMIALLGGTFAVLLGLQFLLKKFGKAENYGKILDISLKVAAITLFTFYIVRNTLSDHFIWTINGGTYAQVYYKKHDYLQSFLRWGYLVSVVLLPCAAFYKSKTLHRFAFVLSLANVVLSIIYYQNYMAYFLKSFVDPTSVRGIITAPWFRHFEFDVEIIMMGIATIIIGLRTNKELLFRKWKDVMYFFAYLPALFLAAIPVYVPQSLIGFTDLYMKLFSVQHAVWLGGTVALCIYMFFLFRNKPKIIQKIVVCFMCLFVFQHYNSMYLMNLNASRLPFQLCNVGSYFMLVAYIFHKRPSFQKFFDFIFIINIFGTIVATIGFDLGEGLMSFWNVHYYLEHIWIFSIPFLMVAFGIYKLPGKGCYKHAVIGFTIYFVLCLGIGLIFNAYCYKPGDRFWNKVNYFYLFDHTVTDLLSFMKPLYKYSVHINGYAMNFFIPLVIYAMYVPGAFVTFLVSRKVCEVAKDHTELHKRKLALKKAAKEAKETC